MRAISSPSLKPCSTRRPSQFAVNWDDELVKATVLTRGGAIVHPNIKLPGAATA